MASSDPVNEQITQEQESQKLKYLGVVHTLAIQAVACFSRLYGYAKENSGSLKPGVESVEGTIKTVVGPVYVKFKDVPFECLKLVDRKVDDSFTGIDRRVPPALKEVSTQAISSARKVPEVAQSLVGEVQHSGVTATVAGIARSAYTKYQPSAKDLYAKCEPTAEQYAVSAWKSLNQLPLFPQVAHIVLPTAVYWTDKYNQAVSYAAKQGYPASYLPVVPTDRIAKVFAGNVAAGGASDIPVEGDH